MDNKKHLKSLSRKNPKHTKTLRLFKAGGSGSVGGPKSPPAPALGGALQIVGAMINLVEFGGGLGLDVPLATIGL